MMRQPPRHIYRQPTVLATGIQATVKWFDPARGFGFVRPADGSGDALLPGAVAQAAGHATIPDGATVVVDLVAGRKGAQVSALHSVDTSTAQAARPARPRPERPGFDRPHFDRPERGERPRFDRPDRLERPDRGPRPERGPRRDAAPAGPTTEVDGTVKWFDTGKGYGFIAPDGGGRDIFVHVRALERGGLSALNEKQRVRVTVRQGDKGPEAVDVSEG